MAQIPHAKIRSALRKLWLWSATRREAKSNARVQRGLYQCAECGLLASDVEIDHIVPVGATPGSKNSADADTWDSFMHKLFCDVDGLRAVCKHCHNRKTYKREG